MQALESCLVYFCDFAAADKMKAATLLKQLGGGQVRVRTVVLPYKHKHVSILAQHSTS